MHGAGIALTICQHCQKEHYWKPAPDVAQQLLSGDLTLHQSAPPSRYWKSSQDIGRVPPIEAN
jgi:hypothetical protein